MCIYASLINLLPHHIHLYCCMCFSVSNVPHRQMIMFHCFFCLFEAFLSFFFSFRMSTSLKFSIYLIICTTDQRYLLYIFGVLVMINGIIKKTHILASLSAVPSFRVSQQSLLPKGFWIHSNSVLLSLTTQRLLSATPFSNYPTSPKYVCSMRSENSTLN